MILLQHRILQDHFLLWIHLATMELHLDIIATQFYLLQIAPNSQIYGDQPKG